MDGQKRNFAYLPHLDGLRAVSVLAILAFHLRPDWLPGGFLGVDIFFIISGFLITSLLLDEVQNHGRIDFLRFYRRRFKRLFPSFILVILLTVISAYILFDQQKFISVAKTALFSIFGISNLYFYKTASYFDLSSIEKPLLHIWSLSVEEQFYFIWPLILFVTYRFFLRNSKKYYLLMGILFLITIYFNLNHPVATFYLPFFRFYEFLLGAGLALFPWKQEAFGKHTRIYFFTSLITLPIIFLTLDSTSLLPGPSSFLFILPVVYLITNGGIESKLNILNLKSFKYIGKRSYTIYLVHWPVIVFYLVSKSRQQLSVSDAIFLILVILFISEFLYRFYELPSRISRNKSKLFWISMLTLTFLVIAICVPTLVLNKKPLTSQRGLIYTQSDIDFGKQARFGTRIKICENKGWENCDVPQSNKFNVLIMGDSHAVDALNAMYTIFPDFDYSMSTLGGCPPTRRMAELVPRTFPDLDKCIKLNKVRFRSEYLMQFDAVVINVLFGWYPPQEIDLYTSFLKSIGIKKVVVFGGYLQTKSELPILINQYGFDRKSIQKEIAPDSVSDSILQEATNKLGYFYVSKKNSLCAHTDCLYWKFRVPFTWDTHHLSFEFANALLSESEDQLKIYFQTGSLN
jgi:peptidoglycan/LPS O-acetylase OafA/YrhL